MIYNIQPSKLAHLNISVTVAHMLIMLIGIFSIVGRGGESCNHHAPLSPHRKTFGISFSFYGILIWVSHMVLFALPMDIELH